MFRVSPCTQFNAIHVAGYLHHADNARTAASFVAAENHLRHRASSAAGHRQTRSVGEASNCRLRHQSAAAADEAATAHRLHSAGARTAAAAHGRHATAAAAADADRTRTGSSFQLRTSGKTRIRQSEHGRLRVVAMCSIRRASA